MRKIEKLLLILLSLFLVSCFGLMENKAHRLILNQNDIRKISFHCGDIEIPLNTAEKSLIIEQINSAKHIGPVIGLVKQKMTVYFNNNDTIQVRFIANTFKWNKSKDYAYKLNFDVNYFNEICLKDY
jgi:hypothetical protein